MTTLSDLLGSYEWTDRTNLDDDWKSQEFDRRMNVQFKWQMTVFSY